MGRSRTARNCFEACYSRCRLRCASPGSGRDRCRRVTAGDDLASGCDWRRKSLSGVPTPYEAADGCHAAQQQSQRRGLWYCSHSNVAFIAADGCAVGAGERQHVGAGSRRKPTPGRRPNFHWIGGQLRETDRAASASQHDAGEVFFLSAVAQVRFRLAASGRRVQSGGCRFWVD